MSEYISAAMDTSYQAKARLRSASIAAVPVARPIPNNLGIPDVIFVITTTVKFLMTLQSRFAVPTPNQISFIFRIQHPVLLRLAAAILGIYGLLIVSALKIKQPSKRL
jgi:hypothetical protein